MLNELTTTQRNSTRTGQLRKKESIFRGTRTMLYTLVSCVTGHSFRGTSIERERLLELCFGQKGERCSRHREEEPENERERVREQMRE
jgi:hypothetical protein